MPTISAKDVQALRKASGAGMMDCKKALEATDGDMEAAAQWLRERGIVKMVDRLDRESNQGAVAISVDGNRAALVELKAETDFSAKAADFVSVVTELADLVLAKGESAVEERTAEVENLNIVKKENISIGKVVRFEAAEGNLIDTYLHRQDGRGVVGVMLEGSGIERELLHEIALHCAFAKPRYLKREDIPVEDIEKERSNLLEITKAEGKPEAAWSKIVEGRVNAWIADQTLLEQGVHGEKETVARRIGSGQIVRMAVAVIKG
jgi:elongation factor Ts